MRASGASGRGSDDGEVLTCGGFDERNGRVLTGGRGPYS